MKTACKAMCTLVLGALILFAGPQAQAQKTAVPNRIVEIVDDTNTVTMHGNVHPLARPQYDRGAVADSQPLSRMMLLLQRGPGQETALRQLMDAQQAKGAAGYHSWLTPQQFGQQFGPSDADVQTLTSWLGAHGFNVTKVNPGKQTLEISG